MTSPTASLSCHVILHITGLADIMFQITGLADICQVMKRTSRLIHPANRPPEVVEDGVAPARGGIEKSGSRLNCTDFGFFGIFKLFPTFN